MLRDSGPGPGVGLLLPGEPFTLPPLRRRCMSSVLKKRRKKMRKHKHKKLRRKQKFLRRRN